MVLYFQDFVIAHPQVFRQHSVLSRQYIVSPIESGGNHALAKLEGKDFEYSFTSLLFIASTLRNIYLLSLGCNALLHLLES